MAVAGGINNFNGEQVEVGRDTGLQLKKALDWSNTEFVSTNFTANVSLADKLSGSFLNYALTAPEKDYARLYLGITPKENNFDTKNSRLIIYNPEKDFEGEPTGQGTVVRNDGLPSKKVALGAYVHSKLTVAKRGEETLTVIGTSTWNSQATNMAMDYYVSTTDKDVYQEAKQITQWFTGEKEAPINLKHFLISGKDSKGNPLPDASEKFIQQIKESTGAIWIASANLSHKPIIDELIKQAKTGREIHVALSERDFSRGDVNFRNLTSDQKALMKENLGLATFAGLATAGITFGAQKKFLNTGNLRGGLIAGALGFVAGVAIEALTPYAYGKRHESQINLAKQITSSGKNAYLHLIENTGTSGKDVHHANFMVINDPKNLIFAFGPMRFNQDLMSGQGKRAATDILFLGKGEQYRKAANFFIQGVTNKTQPQQINQWGSHFSRPVDYFMPIRGKDVTRYVLTTDMLKSTRDWALEHGESLETFAQSEGIGVGLYRGLKLYNTGVWADATDEDRRNYEIAKNFDIAMQSPTIGQSDWWSRTNFSIGTGVVAGASIYAYSNLLGFANNKKYALAAALIGGAVAGAVTSWMGEKLENAYGHDVFKQYGMRGPIDSFLLKMSKHIDEDISKMRAIGGQQDFAHETIMQNLVGTSFDIVDTLVWNIAAYEYFTIPALRLASSGYKKFMYGLERRAYGPASNRVQFVGKSFSKAALSTINTLDTVAMYAIGTLMEGAVLPYAGLFGKEVEKGVQQMTDIFKGKENYRAFRKADRNLPGSLYRSFQVADETLSKIPFFRLGSTRGMTVGAVFAAYDWGFLKSVAMSTVDLFKGGFIDAKNRSHFSKETLAELKTIGLEIQNASKADKPASLKKLMEFAEKQGIERLLSANAQRTLSTLQTNLNEVDYEIKRLQQIELDPMLANKGAVTETFIAENDSLRQLNALLEERTNTLNSMNSLKQSYYEDLAKLENPFIRAKTSFQNWKVPFISAYNTATGISRGRMVHSLAGAVTGTLAMLVAGTYLLNGMVSSLSSAARVTLAEQQEYENMMNSIKGHNRADLQIYKSAGFPRYDINWGEKYGFAGRLLGGIVGLGQFYTERVAASFINLFGGPAKTEINGRSEITNEIAGPGAFAMTALALKAGNLSDLLKQNLSVENRANELYESGNNAANKKLTEEVLLASMFMQPNANTDTSHISSSFAVRFSPSRHLFTITPFQQSSVRGLTTFSSSFMGPASLPIGMSISYPIGIKSYTIFDEKTKTMSKTTGGLLGFLDSRNYASDRPAGTGVVWIPGTTFENMTYSAVYYHGFKTIAKGLLSEKAYNSTGVKAAFKLFDFGYKLSILPFHMARAVASELLAPAASFNYRAVRDTFTGNKGFGKLKTIWSLLLETASFNQDIRAFRTMINSEGLKFNFLESMRVLVRSPLGKERLDTVLSIVNDKINNLPEAERLAYQKAIGYEVVDNVPRMNLEIERGVSGQKLSQSAFFRAFQIQQKIIGGSVTAQERTAAEIFKNSKSVQALGKLGKAGAIAAATMIVSDLILGAIGNINEEFAAGIYRKFAGFALDNLGFVGKWLANFYKVRYKEHPMATTYAPKYLPDLGENFGDKYEYREANFQGRIYSYVDHGKRTLKMFLKGLTEGVYSGLGYFGVVQDRVEENKYAVLKTYTNIPVFGFILSYSEGITTPTEKRTLEEYIAAQNYSAGTRTGEEYVRNMHRMNKKAAATGKMFHEQAGLGSLGISAVMEQSRRTSLTHWVLTNNSGFDVARYFFLRNVGKNNKSFFRPEAEAGSIEMAGYAGKVTYNKQFRVSKTAYSLFQSAQRSSEEAGELGQIDFSAEESYNPTDQLFDSPTGVNSMYEHDLRAKNSLFSQVFTAGAIGTLTLAAGAYIYKNMYPRKVAKNKVVSELDSALKPKEGLNKLVDEYGPRAYGATSDFLNTVTGGERRNFYMTTHGVNAARNGVMVINNGEFDGANVKYPGHRYWLVKIGSEGNYYTFGDLPAHGTDPLHSVSPANYKRVAGQIGLGRSFGQMNFAPVSEFFLQLTRMSHIDLDRKISILAKATSTENPHSARAAVSEFKHLVKTHQDFYYSIQRMSNNAQVVHAQLKKKEEILKEEIRNAKAANNATRAKILESMLAKTEFDLKTVLEHKTTAEGYVGRARTALEKNTENFNFKEANEAIEKIKEIESRLNGMDAFKNDVDAYNRKLISELENTKIGNTSLTEIIQKISKSDLQDFATGLGRDIERTAGDLNFKLTTETTLYKIQGFFGRGSLLALASEAAHQKTLGLRDIFPLVSSNELFTTYSRFWENTGSLNSKITDWYNESFDKYHRESVIKDIRSRTAEAFNRPGGAFNLSEIVSENAAKQWEQFIRSYIENGEVLGSGVGAEGATALEQWRFVMNEFATPETEEQFFEELNKIAGKTAIDEARLGMRSKLWAHAKFMWGGVIRPNAARVLNLTLAPLMYAGAITDPFKKVGTGFIGLGVAGDTTYGRQDREMAAKAGLRDIGSGTATIGAFALGGGIAYATEKLFSEYSKETAEAEITRRGIFGLAKGTAQRKILKTAATTVAKEAGSFFLKRAAVGVGVGLLEFLTLGSGVGAIATGLGVFAAGVSLPVSLAASLLVVGGGFALEFAYQYLLKEKVDKWWNSMVDGQETKIVNYMENHPWLSAPGRAANYAIKNFMVWANSFSRYFDSWIQAGQRPDATMGDRAWANAGGVLKYLTSFIDPSSASNWFYQPQGITGTDLSSSEHLWRLPENAGPAGALASLTPIHYGTQRNAINKLITQQDRLREADPKSLLNFWFHPSNFGVEQDINNTTITGITSLSKARQNIFRSFSNLSVFGEASTAIMVGRSLETGHQLAQLLNRKFDFYNDKKNPEITKGMASEKAWAKIEGKNYARGPGYNVGLRGHVKLLPVYRNLSPFTIVVDSPFIKSRTPDSTPTGIVLPVDHNRYTSAFNELRDISHSGHFKKHKGMDFAGNIGDPIRAAAAGKVVYAGAATGYGNYYVVIEHMINGVPQYTAYGHALSDNKSRFVKKGQLVKPGEQIGKIGSEGFSTGPHLHFSVSIYNPIYNSKTFDPVFKDPAEFLRGLSLTQVGGKGKGGVDLPVPELSVADIKDATSKAMINKNVNTFASMDRYKTAKQRLKEYEEIIQEAHRKYPNVASNLIRAVVTQESTGYNSSQSGAGASGLMQLMPETAKDMGVRDRLNPRDNIFGGTRYLSRQLIRYNGDLTKALMAYNAGPGNVDNKRAYSFSESTKYAPAVVAYLSMYNLEKPQGKDAAEYVASSIPLVTQTKHVDVTIAASTDVPAPIDNSVAKNMVRKAVGIFESVIASAEKIFGLSTGETRKLIARATYPSGENWQSLYDNHYTPGIEFTSLDNHHGAAKH